MSKFIRLYKWVSINRSSTSRTSTTPLQFIVTFYIVDFALRDNSRVDKIMDGIYENKALKFQLFILTSCRQTTTCLNRTIFIRILSPAPHGLGNAVLVYNLHLATYMYPPHRAFLRLWGLEVHNFELHGASKAPCILFSWL